MRPSPLGRNASWQATPLISLGPYLNFNRTTSDFSGSLDAVGFGLNVSYELSGKTSLSGALGFQNQSFDDGGGAAPLSASLTATWQPDELYRVMRSFSTSTIASPTTVDQFVNNYDFNVGVSRPLGEGSLSLGTESFFFPVRVQQRSHHPAQDNNEFSVSQPAIADLFFTKK